ncbi:hypothetical protein K7432_014765 [Basidiobolus ranarum]
MQCFAIALQIPDSEGGMNYFSDKHPWSESSGTMLRFHHYPQQSNNPGVPLAGCHSDYGSVTILIQKDIPGLEVKAYRSHNDQTDVPWISAPVIPETLLINIGDAMQMWTNGLLKSTKHRVVYHPAQQTQPRYSIACFLQLSDDTRFHPVPSPLISNLNEGCEDENALCMTAKEYLQYKLEMTYGNLMKSIK